MSDRPTVGMVGLGNMGGRMAARLAAGGYAVTGFDVDASRAAALGLAAGSSPADVAARCEVVMLSLPSSAIVERVVRGPDGLAASTGDRRIVVDLSTSNPASTVQLHRELAAVGIELVDAGISGGAAAAEAGKLTIMVGTSAPEVMADLDGPFATFASEVVVMGSVGTGHTTKALNNFLNAISLSATSEVMIAAKRAGLELGALLRVLNSSSGVNFATLNRFPHIIEGDYLEGGLTSQLMMKDIALYVEHLASLGVPSLHASGPVAAFGAAIHLGYGDEISNRVVDALGDLAGGVRVHDQ